MDENDLKGVAEAMNELRETGTLSAEALAKLSGNSTSAYKALEGYTKSLLGATGAIGGMAKAVAQGEGSFASLGSSIVGLTGVVGKLASAIPLVGGAAKALAEGVGEASKFILDQLDVMAKNYQTLGDASAGAADGVDGLLRQFNQMGNYSLPAFAKAVKSNTLGLSALSGTAAMGAEELSNIAGALTTGDTARQFLKLGISLDGVGDAAASFISNSSRLGLLQSDTTEELTKKTQNYILEVDKIARMTGQTREQQQQEAQKTLINTRFRAKLADMTANGQAEAAEQLRLTAEGLGGAAGEAFRATATGIPATKAAAKANILYGDQIRQNVEAVKGGKQAQDAINDVMVAGAAGAQRFNTLLQFGGDKFEGAANQALDYEQQVNANLRKGMTPAQAAAAAQKAQAEAAGETTEKFVNANLAVANSSKSLQSLGFSLAEYAIPAVETFATTLDSVTSFLNKRFGIGGTVSSRGAYHGPAGGPAGGGDVERIMATIRARESNGNYNAQNPQSSASGAYQFIDSTWQGLTKKYGMGGEFKSAKMAPKEIQDAIAKKYVDDILKQAGGDVSKVPLAWYTGNIQGNLGGAKIAPGNPGVAEYQSKWMGEYNNISGPSSRYKSPVTSVGNPTSAGSETQAQSRPAVDQQSGSGSMSVSKKLDELIALQRQSNAIETKILQHTKQ